MATTKFRATRLSYANVMATIAVFIALGGGAYAAFTLPPNSVGTKQLKDSAVTKKKLAPEQSFVAPTLASGVTAIGPPEPPFSDPGYMEDNSALSTSKGRTTAGGRLAGCCSSSPRATDRARSRRARLSTIRRRRDSGRSSRQGAYRRTAAQPGRFPWTASSSQPLEPPEPRTRISDPPRQCRCRSEARGSMAPPRSRI